MAQRFVAITLEVDDKGTPKVEGLKNAFDDLDSTAQKTSSGGLRSAFDSSSLLRAELTSLTQRVPIVGSVFNGLSVDLVRFAKDSEAAGGSAGKLANSIAVSFKNADAEVISISGNVGKLQQAYRAFESRLGQAAGEGRTDFAGFNIEGALRRPEEAFGRFVSNLQEVERAEDRTSMVAEALGASHTKLVPQLEAATVGLTAQGTAATAASGGLAGMLGPIALVIVAMAALVLGGGAVSKVAFDLSKHAAEAGGQIYELQQQTKLGAETLSALSVVAKLTGSGIGDLSGALDTFDKVITRANAGDLKLSKQFRDSNIDISNHERALRSVFQVLNQMPEGQKRAELANLAFGDSSKAVLEIINETNGDIDEAIKKYGALGLILSNDATRAANKFNDQLTLLNLQVDSVKVRVGQQLMPVVLEVVQRISTHVKNNQERWIEWARSAVESGRDIKTGAETVGEAYVKMQTHIAQTTPAFHLLDDSMGASLGTMLRYGTGLGLIVTGLEKLGNVVNRLKGPSPNAIPGLEDYLKTILPKDAFRPDLAVPLREGGFSSEQLEKFQKELDPFINLFGGINARLETFGQTSHVAAVQQQALKLQIKELSPEVRDQAQAFISNALAAAKQLDALEAQKKANEEAIKQAERVTKANENLRNEIDAIRLRTQQLGDTESKARTELEKFNEALIKRKDRDLLDPDAIKEMQRALEGLDVVLARIASSKNFERLQQEAKQVANSLQSIGENIAQAAAGAIPDFEQRLLERDSVLQRTARSIESISHLKIDRTQFAGLIDLFKSGPEAVNLEQALAKLRAQLDPKVLENIAPREISLIIDLMFKAAQADRALAAAQTPLARATAQLNAELKALQNEVPIAAETAALRYQIAWQDAYNGVVLASDAAVIQQIYSQARLADSTIFHADQANAAVLDFLASQRSVTEVIADAKIGVIQSTFDLIDRGLDKFTSKLGVIGSLVRDLLSGFIRLALSKFFQAVLGNGGGSGFGQTQAAGAGGGGLGGTIGNVLNRVFSGGGAGGTSGGSGPLGQLASSVLPGLGGGGIGVPQSLTSQLASQGAINTALGGAQQTLSGLPLAGGAGGLGLAGIGASLAPILPLLGLAGGARLGGQSRTGSILGGAGGLIGGIGLAAALSPGFALGAGSFIGGLPGLAGVGGFLSTAGPLALLGVTAAIAAPLIIGAIILSKNAARRRDETTRNQTMLDSLAQLNELLQAVKRNRTDGQSAIMAALGIREQYVAAMSALKDGKTRRIALADVSRLDAVIGQIRGAADVQVRRREIEARIVPEFATGVDFKAGMNPSDYYLPKAARGLMSIPGAFDRKDDVLMRVSRGEHVAVMTPQQYGRIGGRDTFQAAGVPAFDGGGFFAPGVPAPVVRPAFNYNRAEQFNSSFNTGMRPSSGGNSETLTLNLNIEGVDAEQVTFKGLHSTKNRRLVVKINDQANINRE